MEDFFGFIVNSDKTAIMEYSMPNVLRMRETRVNYSTYEYGNLFLIQIYSLQEQGSINVRHNLHVTRAMIDRLGLEKELEGHSGCVNCLEWNTKGE